MSVFRQRVTAAFLGSVLIAAAWAQTEQKAKRVRGSALHALLAESQFSDDAHFTYRFRRDGQFTGTELGRDIRGTWRIRNDKMCMTWIRPPGREECYVVRKMGVEISFFVNGSEAWYGQLKKAAP